MESSFRLLALALAMVSLVSVQASPEPQSSSNKVTNKRQQSGTKKSEAIRLTIVQWPFAKPEDPGVKVMYRWSKTGYMHGESLFVEPILMKGNEIVFEYGCGLSFSASVGNPPNPETLQVQSEYKDGVLTLLGTVDDPMNGKHYVPISIDGTKKEPENKRVGPSGVADFKGIDPFRKLPTGANLNFKREAPILGGRFTLKPRSLNLAYDSTSLATLLVDADMAQMPEYGMAYLAACKLNGVFALDKSQVKSCIEGLRVYHNVNDPSIAQNAAKAKVQKMCDLLNGAMVQWAKAGSCLVDVLAPADEGSGASMGQVFAAVKLPAQELRLVQNYKANASKMSGPEKLILRMTINRLLLDRLLVTEWMAAADANGTGMTAQGRPYPKSKYRNVTLRELATSLERVYGMAGSFTAIQARMSMFWVTARPTFLAKPQMEPVRAETEN